MRITLSPSGRAARVKALSRFAAAAHLLLQYGGKWLPPRRGAVPFEAPLRRARRLGAPNWPGPRPRRAKLGTRPERRLHANNRHRPYIASSPASRGQAQNRTAATLSQIKFFHSMWTNLFAVAGTCEHPPAGVIRKRGRSAPSCVPAAHSREYAVMNQQHGKSASAAQMRVNEPLLVCARPRRRTIPWARNARPYEG